MLKIRRPLGRLIFNMGIAIPCKTVFLIETAPCWWHTVTRTSAGTVVTEIRNQRDTYKKYLNLHFLYVSSSLCILAILPLNAQWILISACAKTIVYRCLINSNSKGIMFVIFVHGVHRCQFHPNWAYISKLPLTAKAVMTKFLSLERLHNRWATDPW